MHRPVCRGVSVCLVCNLICSAAWQSAGSRKGKCAEAQDKRTWTPARAVSWAASTVDQVPFKYSKLQYLLHWVRLGPLTALQMTRLYHSVKALHMIYLFRN